MRTSSLGEYREVGAHGGVEASSPHQLILLLMSGALDAIAVAKGHMRRGEVSSKGVSVSRAISIIDGLRFSLDHSVGGDLVANLDDLYQYMGQRLLQANMKDNPEWLDEVSGLMREIKDAWEQIPPEAQKVIEATPEEPTPIVANAT